MGGCLSKKAKEDPNTSSLLGSKKEAKGSRDPPPTESPPQIEEEKVKEVLSETPTRFVRASSNRREPAKVAHGLKMEESDLGSYINAADLCSSRSVGVLANPPSESFSAASTSLISDNTRAAAPPDDDDDDDEEGETAEMKLKMMLMKKKKKRSLSSSSIGMPRSRSPAAKTRGPAPAAAAGKREFRAVDVGCRSGRPSPSPMRSREMGNYARNHINSSSSYNGNIYNNTKTGDMVLIGERDGMRRMRSMSPAASSLKSRSSELEAAAATKISLDHQHQQRGRHCRSLSSSTATNGRFSPQRIPARALDLGARRRGNPNAGGGSAGDGDGMTLLMEEGKEESLENPLVSLECFIFL